MKAILLFCAPFVISSTAFSESSSRFPVETTQILLSARLSKWQEIVLERSIGPNLKVVHTYRWVIRTGTRDRRGPGAYLHTTECILSCPGEAARVIKETASEFEVKFNFVGTDATALLHLRVRSRGGYAEVSFSGDGEVYQEFMTRIKTLTRECPENNSLEWSYYALKK